MAQTIQVKDSTTNCPECEEKPPMSWDLSLHLAWLAWNLHQKGCSGVRQIGLATWETKTLEVLGLPLFFIGWFPSFTMIIVGLVSTHHPKGRIFTVFTRVPCRHPSKKLADVANLHVDPPSLWRTIFFSPIFCSRWTTNNKRRLLSQKTRRSPLARNIWLQKSPQRQLLSFHSLDFRLFFFCRCF